MSFVLSFSCLQVRRFLAGFKTVLIDSLDESQKQSVTKLSILEAGMAVLLRIVAEGSAKLVPLASALATTKSDLETAQLKLADVAASADTMSRGSDKYRTVHV